MTVFGGELIADRSLSNMLGSRLVGIVGVNGCDCDCRWDIVHGLVKLA